MNAETKPTLADRVLQFQLMELPGQPMMMHMGTSYLINDLWSAHKEMAEALAQLIAEYADPTEETWDQARAALLKAGG